MPPLSEVRDLSGKERIEIGHGKLTAAGLCEPISEVPLGHLFSPGYSHFIRSCCLSPQTSQQHLSNKQTTHIWITIVTGVDIPQVSPLKMVFYVGSGKAFPTRGLCVGVSDAQRGDPLHYGWLALNT